MAGALNKACDARRKACAFHFQKGEKKMKIMNLLKCFIMIALFTFLIIPTGQKTFAEANQPQDNLKIALLIPQTGPVPSFGVSSLDGAQMAVDEWNAAGGVLGKTIQLDIYDTKCNGTTATSVANSVVAAGYHYIIGEVCSGASIPISDIAEASHVVQITPTSTDSRITLNGDGTVKQYVFRACFTDPYEGSMMAKFALQKGWKKGFILHDPSNSYSTNLASAFHSAYTSGGGSVAGDHTYLGTDTDFSALVQLIKTSQVDIVYLPDYYNVVNLFVAQARTAGVNSIFLGGDGWDSPDLDTSVTNGSYFSNHFSADNPNLNVQNWVQNYKSLYSTTPDSISALSYDAAQILLTAIKGSNVDDPSVVKTYLARHSYNAITGETTFDAFHNPNKPIVVEQIKNNVVSFFTSFIQYPTFMPFIIK
jgi:branched-chain amino acid transport system substrate-binding protein